MRWRELSKPHQLDRKAMRAWKSGSFTLIQLSTIDRRQRGWQSAGMWVLMNNGDVIQVRSYYDEIPRSIPFRWAEQVLLDRGLLRGRVERVFMPRYRVEPPIAVRHESDEPAD